MGASPRAAFRAYHTEIRATRRYSIAITKIRTQPSVSLAPGKILRKSWKYLGVATGEWLRPVLHEHGERPPQSRIAWGAATDTHQAREVASPQEYFHE